MNIIKLKDQIKPNDDFFNTYLKDKYAYWIHMRYIVPFESMDYAGYVACESDINKLLIKEDGTYPSPYGCQYIDTQADCSIYNYIDMDVTNVINCVNDYIIKNEYVPDKDITLDELKKFRTWLASTLLKFDQNAEGYQLYDMYDNTTTIMLNYYKMGMIDETIQILTDMKPFSESSEYNTQCSCCCSELNISDLYKTNEICDPIQTYRLYIYNKMVLTFSDINFWVQFPKEFLLEFKKYIDNIIKVGLPLYSVEPLSNFSDCGGLSRQEREQNNNVYILNKLSESLNYLIYDELTGHKNFICDSFSSWSSLLYEKMEW